MSDAATPYDPDHTALLTQREDVFSCLRELKFKPADAKLAATWCDHLLGQSLETCVKYALQQLVMPRFKRSMLRPSQPAVAHAQEAVSDSPSPAHWPAA